LGLIAPDKDFFLAGGALTEVSGGLVGRVSGLVLGSKAVKVEIKVVGEIEVVPKTDGTPGEDKSKQSQEREKGFFAQEKAESQRESRDGLQKIMRIGPAGEQGGKKSKSKPERNEQGGGSQALAEEKKQKKKKKQEQTASEKNKR
jgi:hypothetical protein